MDSVLFFYINEPVGFGKGEYDVFGVKHYADKK